MISARAQKPTQSSETPMCLQKKRLLMDKLRLEILMRKISRRKNELIQPFPTGTIERLQCNHVLERLLEYLTHPRDMLNAKDTCTAFQEILEEWIMTKIFRILKDQKNLHLGESCDVESTSVDKDVLNLRLVSKSWKRAAEEIFMNAFSKDWYLDLDHGSFLVRGELRKFEPNRMQYQRYPKAVIVNCPRDFEKDDRMQVLAHSDYVFPLIQILRVDEYKMDCLADYYFSRIPDFLEKYGTSINGLILDWSEKNSSVLGRYQRLFRLVEHMPNLKLLVLKRSSDGHQGSFSRPRSNEEHQEFERYMKFDPFPKIPSLEVFSVDYYYDYENPSLLNEIVTRSENLKSVFIEFDDSEGDSIVSALSRLQMNCYYYNGRIEPNNYLLRMTWPLQKIRLSCFEFNADLVELLNRFGDTLNHLELDPSSRLTIGSPWHGKLELPQVKTLRLHQCIISVWGDLDFIIPFRRLEFLHIEHQRETLHANHMGHLFEMLAFRKYLYEMRNSNIWEYLPRLRKVQVDVEDDVQFPAGEGLFSLFYERYGNCVRKIKRIIPKGPLSNNADDFELL